MYHGYNDNTKNSSIIYMMEEMREKYLINNKKIIIISSTNEIQEIKLVIQIKILLVDPASGTNNLIVCDPD